MGGTARTRGNIETRVTELEQSIAAYDKRIGIAITEGHLSLSPHNANPILYEWLSAAYHARSLNIYQRHGARVKIATAADFQGNRWTNNAVMLQTPRGVSYLMPVGSIARLFKRHNGTHGIAVKSAPPGLDIAASRAGNKLFLHVANLEYRKAVEASFAVEGLAVRGGRVFQIAPENLREASVRINPTSSRRRNHRLRVRGASRRAPWRRSNWRWLDQTLAPVFARRAARAGHDHHGAGSRARFLSLRGHESSRPRTWRAPRRSSSSRAGSRTSALRSSCSPAAWAPSSGRSATAAPSRFLWTRGLWLILLEITVMRVAFYFSFSLQYPVLLVVLWALGGSMIALALLSRLPLAACSP